MLWGVVLADGKIEDYESNLMRKISSLLHVSSFETAEAKQRAMKEIMYEKNLNFGFNHG